jgi:hypothetical protein
MSATVKPKYLLFVSSAATLAFAWITLGHATITQARRPLTSWQFTVVLGGGLLSAFLWCVLLVPELGTSTTTGHGGSRVLSPTVPPTVRFVHVNLVDPEDDDSVTVDSDDSD